MVPSVYVSSDEVVEIASVSTSVRGTVHTGQEADLTSPDWFFSPHE